MGIPTTKVNDSTVDKTMSTELDSILSEIRGDAPANPYLSKIPKQTFAPTKINTGQVQDVKYNVNRDAIYDRLHDGTYVPRFENYAGATGNENRLANQQGVIEQSWNGLVKAGAKTFNYAMDATLGTVYGIFNAVGEGSIEGLYDNDFSNKLDDWNKRLDYSLPNYYSDEQKSMGVLRSMATVNFWANDVAGGLAFVGGALLPELAIAAATGGASAPISLAKIGLKAGTRSFLKAGSKKIVKEGIESGLKTGFKQGVDDVGLNLLRGQRYAKIGEYTGEVIKTAGFLTRTSNFEAGMEARHNLHQSTSEYLSSFEELNGRPPTFEEYSGFLDDAVTASNWVYGANMAILSLSNMAMFGAKFGVGINTGKTLNNFGNKFIGLGVKKTAGKEAVLSGANRLQRFTGNSYLILSKPAIEGIYEEGLQGVAGTTMQNYLKAKYDPDYEDGYGLWSSLTDAFAQQYGTKEGWKEMAIGMIIGMGAPALQGQAPNGFGKNSRKRREARIQEDVNKANEGRGQLILRNTDRANTMVSFRNKMESQFLNDEDTELSNTIINTEFIKTQEHLKTAGEIVEDFDAIIDNTEFTKEQIEDLGGTENAQAYKESLKTNFAADAKNYRSAKQLVESIGLGGKLKNTPGNIQEIGEALTMSFMVGKTSLSKAKLIAEQIDALTGSQGVFNSLEHYNNLSQDKKNKIVTLKEKRAQLAELRKTATSLGSQIAGVQVGNGARIKGSNAEKTYNKFSEKLVVTQNSITRLEQELATLSEAIDLDFRAENTNLDGTLSIDPSFQSVEIMLEEVDRLDAYVASLNKSGKSADASALNALLTEFKMYSDAHRQTNSDFRRMFDTNFFSKSKEGAALNNTVLGRKYVMSDDFRNLIRENDELIDESLRKSGVRGYRNVEEAIKQTIEENEEISDREKYRRESIIRMLLGAERLRNRLFEAQAEYEEIIESAEATKSTNPLEGDTIVLKKRLNPQGQDLSNLDIINNMINDIVEEIDAIRNVKGKQEELKNLQLEAEGIRKEEVEPELEKGDYKKALKVNNLADEFLTDVQRDLLNTYRKFLDRETRLSAVEEQIKAAEKGANFKIASTEEYQKLKDLTEKRQSGAITPEELIELQEVADDIDQWLLITGTVIEGLRLSDLIKQKVVLENTPVTKVEKISEVTSQEVIDQIDMPDKTEATNYSYGQTYEGVTAINTVDGIEISGINPETFTALTGIENPVVTPQGNILIDQETQKAINSGGVLSILPTNKNLSTNYSVVLVTRPNLNGEESTQPLTSTFNSDFNGEMDPDAIYSIKAGDELFLEVNPSDAYNQQLLAVYKEVLGETTSSTISKEDLEEALDEDTKYQDLTLDLEMLEEQERKATTDKKPGITKKRLKKKEAVAKRAAEVEKKLINAAGKSKTRPSDETLETVKEALRRSLVIRVKDGNGNFVAVLKAKRNSAVKSVEASEFESLRDQIVEDDAFMLRLMRTGVSEQIPVKGVVVTKQVLIGHPNFNFSKNPDGTVSIDSKAITEEQLKFIQDIGYVQNGKVFTKSKEKGINTTFLKRSISQPTDAKIPFVVISRGDTKFAYPVKLLPQEKTSLDDFKKIYDSELRPVDKVISLNTYMAGRGIDIKQPGNSFSIFNLTNDNKFFEEKIAQMESMDYYRETDSWIDPKIGIASDIVGQVSIDVDITSPLHSPKIQMDFSGLDVKKSPVKETKKQETKAKKSTMESGSGVANFLHKCK